jgi:hypothetical protein
MNDTPPLHLKQQLPIIDSLLFYFLSLTFPTSASSPEPVPHGVEVYEMYVLPPVG